MTFSQQQRPPILTTPLHPTNGGDFTSKIHHTLSHSLLRLSTQLPPRGHTRSHICPDAAPVVRPITFGWQQRLPVLTAPANGVDFTGGEVTPKVLGAVLLITLIAQPEQRATGYDDGGHPVGTWGGLVGHLHPHPFDKATLQAALHLPSKTHTTSATANWAPVKSEVLATSTLIPLTKPLCNLYSTCPAKHTPHQQQQTGPQYSQRCCLHPKRTRLVLAYGVILFLRGQFAVVSNQTIWL